MAGSGGSPRFFQKKIAAPWVSLRILLVNLTFRKIQRYPDMTLNGNISIIISLLVVVVVVISIIVQ